MCWPAKREPVAPDNTIPYLVIQTRTTVVAIQHDDMIRLTETLPDAVAWVNVRAVDEQAALSSALTTLASVRR